MPGVVAADETGLTADEAADEVIDVLESCVDRREGPDGGDVDEETVEPSDEEVPRRRNGMLNEGRRNTGNVGATRDDDGELTSAIFASDR